MSGGLTCSAQPPPATAGLEASDLDFVVEFEPLPPGVYANTYFGLLEALQQLFDRPVDLVVESAIKNPYFLEAVEATRTLLYET